MAARTALSHAKMSGKKIIGLLLNNKSILFLFLFLFFCFVCLTSRKLLRGAGVENKCCHSAYYPIRATLAGCPLHAHWTEILSAMWTVTQTNLQFCFYLLLWDRGACRPTPAGPPPTVSSSLSFTFSSDVCESRFSLPQFAFSSPSDAKTRRFHVVTSGFPCERVSLGGGIEGVKKKKSL